MKKILLILITIIMISSCKKQDDTFFNISIISTNPTSLQEFQENIVVEIEFEHSKGFMGFYDPDYLSLEVKDSRLQNADYYHLIPLIPPDNELAIQGIIKLEIDSMQEELKILLIPKDPNDNKNIILEIRSGTGGDEAALFAADLYRMYVMYAEKQNLKMEIVNLSKFGGNKVIPIIQLRSSMFFHY